MNDKLKSYLGLAKRANKLSLGNDMVLEAIDKRIAKLVIFSSDASSRTVDNIQKKARSKSIHTVRIKENMNFINSSIGKKCAVVAINDEGFSKKICYLIEGEKDIL